MRRMPCGLQALLLLAAWRLGRAFVLLVRPLAYAVSVVGAGVIALAASR